MRELLRQDAPLAFLLLPLGIPGDFLPLLLRLRTEKGFKFDRVDTHMWHAPVGTETDELESMFEEYGFNVEYYDDAVAEE